ASQDLESSYESRPGYHPVEVHTQAGPKQVSLHNQAVEALEQLRSAGERAFGVPFSGDMSAPHCVFQKVLFTLMKAGPHTLSFLNYTKPYGDRPNEFGRAMPTASQRQAWAEHTAWTAVDYAEGGIDLELEYAVLAGLCAEMLDANCVGVYVPRERMFIPNDGSLLPELHRIASLRHRGVTHGRNRVN
ncbi:MAG: hypothetical protein ABSG11_24285, partial [Candidatus Korobacteraceae bacterium]